MTRNYTAVAHGAELVETSDIRENFYEYQSRYYEYQSRYIAD